MDISNVSIALFILLSDKAQRTLRLYGCEAQMMTLWSCIIHKLQRHCEHEYGIQNIFNTEFDKGPCEAWITRI